MEVDVSRFDLLIPYLPDWCETPGLMVSRAGALRLLEEEPRMMFTTTEAAVETALATGEYPENLPAGGPRVGRPTRRHFSIEYKRRVLAEYDAAPTGSKGLVLRREGLYDASVKRWRTQLEAGTLGGVSTPTPRRGKKSPEQQRISELETQVAKLEAESAKKG